MRLSASEMDMVRKPVRRKAFLPYVKHWIAGGAVVGIIMTTVLMILDVSNQQDTDTIRQDVKSQPREELEAQKSDVRPIDVPLGPSSDTEEIQETTAAPNTQFVFYDLLPIMEVVIQDDEPPASIKQEPTTDIPVDTALTASADTYYLQAGSFRDKGRADNLLTRLADLGFKSEIHDISINDTDVYHRVRTGPFTNSVSLETTQRKLADLGIETQKVKGY